VSGELHAWSENVVELLEEVNHRVHVVVENEHPQVFKTIVKNHSNLLKQVEKMRDDEAALLSRLPLLLSEARQFRDGVDETVLAEQQFHAKREKLANDGLSFVLEVRKMQTAADTWLAESLQRDNGVGD
jgi:hypothetical protein